MLITYICDSLKNEKLTLKKLLSQFKYLTCYDHLMMQKKKITAAKSPGRHNWISNITVIKYKGKRML